MLNIHQTIDEQFALPTSVSTTDFGRLLEEDVVVRDEHRSHRGLAHVRDWRINTKARTPFRARPIRVEEHVDAVVVTTEVPGDLPGSPVMLDHRFSMRDKRITSLEFS